MRSMCMGVMFVRIDECLYRLRSARNDRVTALAVYGPRRTNPNRFVLVIDTTFQYHAMNESQTPQDSRTDFSRPTPAGVKWNDALAFFVALGAEITEREVSRVAVFLFGQTKVMHRPHPSPDMDKGAVASIRGWLEENGVKP